MEAINETMLEQWKADRLGKFTSSAMGKLMTKPRSKDKVFSDQAESYIYAKVGESLTLESNEVSSAAIKWGEEHEADAARVFAEMSGFKVEVFGKTNPVFYPYKDDPGHAGGSPDGAIIVPQFDKELCLEIKCPYESRNHAEVLHLVTVGKFDLRSFDPDYYAQVQANIFFMGASGGYFVSYDPRCVDYKYCCVWAFVERDEEFITSMIDRLNAAIRVKKETLGEIGFYNSLKSVA